MTDLSEMTPRLEDEAATTAHAPCTKRSARLATGSRETAEKLEPSSWENGSRSSLLAPASAFRPDDEKSTLMGIVSSWTREGIMERDIQKTGYRPEVSKVLFWLTRYFSELHNPGVITLSSQCICSTEVYASSCCLHLLPCATASLLVARPVYPTNTFLTSCLPCKASVCFPSPRLSLAHAASFPPPPLLSVRHERQHPIVPVVEAQSLGPQLSPRPNNASPVPPPVQPGPLCAR
jgi:hypothetical protein